MNMIKHQRPNLFIFQKSIRIKVLTVYQRKEKVGIKHWIYCSQTIDYVYENLEEYNGTKKKKVLVVFDDIIADMHDNKY